MIVRVGRVHLYAPIARTFARPVAPPPESRPSVVTDVDEAQQTPQELDHLQLFFRRARFFSQAPVRVGTEGCACRRR